MTREEESPFQPQKKRKKIQKRDEFRVFVLKALFWDTHFLLLLLLGFFQTVVFCLPKVKISLKKKNGRQKRPPKHQLLRLSTGFLRYHPIGRTCVVALSVSFSLSLFCKGKKKKKRKRADDDDADDVSNDFVVVLLHGCNENQNAETRAPQSTPRTEDGGGGGGRERAKTTTRRRSRLPLWNTRSIGLCSSSSNMMG